MNQISRIIALPYKLHNKLGSTLFNDIRQLNPSTYLKINLNDNSFEVSKYWDINKPFIEKVSLKDLKKKIYDTFIDSVRIRLRTDRNFAFLVSGGIDSTAILGCVKKKFGLNPTTFSLDLPDKRFNENSSINEVIDELNLNHKYIKVSSEVFEETLNNYEKKMDTPLATPNAILHMILSKNISSENINVVLNGVGGDEVFFGYHDHFLYHLYNLKKKGSKKFTSELDSWTSNFGKSKSIFTNFCTYIESDNYKVSPDYLSRSGNFDYRILLKDIKFNDTNLEKI